MLRDHQQVRAFLLARWQERAAELGREEPATLEGACRFCALFGELALGLAHRANFNHSWNEDRTGNVIDLCGGDSTYRHDSEFIARPEFREKMESCRPRVERWVSEFRAECAAKEKA